METTLSSYSNCITEEVTEILSVFQFPSSRILQICFSLLPLPYLLRGLHRRAAAAFPSMLFYRHRDEIIPKNTPLLNCICITHIFLSFLSWNRVFLLYLNTHYFYFTRISTKWNTKIGKSAGERKFHVFRENTLTRECLWTKIRTIGNVTK